MTRYAIRYDSRSTVNGQELGMVYAMDIGHISPGCWSHTKTPTEATLFSDYDSAFAVKQSKKWASSAVVEVDL